MSDADLKIIVFAVFLLTLYSAFLLTFAGSEFSETQVEETESGFLGGLIPDLNLDFLNPFSEGFNSEFALINIFVFVPILLILVIVGLRFLRGV